MKKIIISCAIMLMGFSVLLAERLNLTFLDRSTIGADKFIKNNADADGRGVVVFILDSGVDPSVKGLTKTSQERVKVIDMQDFTGQLEISLKKAEKENIADIEVLKIDKTKIEGWDKLEFKPSDGNYYMGFLDEDKSYKNSAVKDINNNGRTDDVFTILSFKIDNAYEILKDTPGFVKVKESESLWVFYIDEDIDGHIDDEKAMFDYKYRYDTFDFHKGEKETKPLMTLSGNIIHEGPTLVINTNDNPHGTHCAGIAAGYEINAQEGFDGIAPGAYIVSLKIGNDILSGGATVTGSMKKAYEYGVKFMKEAGFKHGVYSMSYGIGSETPGRSDMEKFLNKFSREHPEVVIVKSMGNSGPGINSSGNPSNDPSTLTIGAMISPPTLKNLYGSYRKTNWVTHFSSRGGCVNKPDVLAPGAASSTVPAYMGADAFWGTSMSTPQVAGACALLFSAALKNDLVVDGFMIKKALSYTANKIPGYSFVDYGNGIVDLNKAFEYLKILNKRKENKKVLFYNIETTNTFYDDMKSETAYWNTGGYFPNDGEKQIVKITPVFPEDVSELEKSEFYRVFSLKSTESWLVPDKSEIYIKGTQGASFGLKYDQEKLEVPGIYSAKIYGYTRNEENGGYADFDVLTTVVVPYKLNIDDSYSLKFNNKKLNIGDIERYFIEVPAGASAMNVILSPVNNRHYNMALYIYDPIGNRVHYSESPEKPEKSNKQFEYRVSKKDLKKGIWEIIPYSHYKSTNDSYYNLQVKFFTMDIQPETINSINYRPGEKPELNVKIFNNSNEAEVIKAFGKVEGYSYNEEYKLTGQTAFRKKFKVGEDISSVEFEIDMPIDDFNKMTDIALNVYDLSGKSILSSGMGRKSGSLKFIPPSPGKYEFEIYPGFISDEVKIKTWTFSVKEKYYYSKPIAITAEKNNLVVYPQKWYDIKFSLEHAYPVAPDNFLIFGEIKLTNRDGNLVRIADIDVK
jgi:tripeptidyl-peptidase II